MGSRIRRTCGLDELGNDPPTREERRVLQLARLLAIGRLTSLPPTELAKEAELSRQILMQELGTAPAIFCFSYTDFNPAVIDASKRAGYDYAVAGHVPARVCP